MRKVQVLVLSAAVLYATIEAAKFPPNLKICHQNDANFDECLKIAVQDALKKLKHGNPTLGLLPLDPLKITTLDLGKSTGPVNIGLRFDNVTMHGISESIIKVQKSNLSDYHLYAESLTPRLKMEANYEMDGRVLLLPIRGKGKSVITLMDLQTHLTQQGERLEKNGNVYMNEVDFDVKMEPAAMEVQFNNLFNGDVALGNNMNKFLNENWRDVLKELKPGLESALGQLFKNLANRFFLKVPFNEVFPK
ncbi:protein takeout [Anabrus simplex]|uniref:protein takeout n=1 Tax=Anabrus simplex TaxID=316456 RepID=UPI0035A39E24